VTQEKNC